MRIGFVNAPRAGGFVGAEDCCIALGTARLLPARLLACASEAKRAGHDVFYYDASIERGRIPDCDLIVYPLMWQIHKQTHKQVAARAGRGLLAPLAIPPGYNHHFARLDPRPAIVLYSEAEEVVAKMPLDFARFSEWRETARGVMWLDEYGILCGGGRLPNCLGNLGGVDYSLVPSSYWSQYPQASYQVTRGCYHACTFCMWGASTVTDRAFKMRAAEQVAEDLIALRRYAGREIRLYLLAAQLTPNLDWLRRFCSAMEQDPYHFETNVNLLEVTDEKIDLLRRAEMTKPTAGLEAVTDWGLSAINKGHNVEQALDGIRCLERSDYRYRLHLRCGYGEDEAEAHRATEALETFASVMKPRSQLDIGPLVYYEGTEIRERCQIELAPHPDYAEYCPIQADIPWSAWMKFASEMARRGLLYRRGLKGVPREHLARYSEFVKEWIDDRATGCVL